MDETRRTLAELIARYQLEPLLRDVYVEGPFDASFLTWLLTTLGATNAVVYSISTVEVLSSVLAKHSLTSGEKQRVIAFAREIIEGLEDCSSVTCVVDADLDRVFGTLPTEPIILITDYTSLEAYLFQQQLLEQWLSVTARLGRVNTAEVMGILSRSLRELFFARCANLYLGWRLTWISIDAGLRQAGKTKDRYVFDGAQFIDRLLQRNNRSKEKRVFLSAIDAFRSKVPADPRHVMHGHDFIDLLSLLVRRKSGQRWLHTPEAVLGSLAGAVKRESIEQEETFKALFARVSNA